MKHRWTDAGTVMASDTLTGCEEHERKCERCGLVKITVHQPIGWPYRLWRPKDGNRFSDPGTPPCELSSHSPT